MYKTIPSVHTEQYNGFMRYDVQYKTIGDYDDNTKYIKMHNIQVV